MITVMNHLEYKGYYGSIEYSKEDKCLYGKVLGMTKDCILYEGNTIEELETDFEIISSEEIEEYLKDMEERK